MTTINYLERSPQELHALAVSITSTDELLKLFAAGRGESFRMAVESIDEFWPVVYPNIVEWLIEPTLPTQLVLLPSKENLSVSLTQVQVRSILAHAFFLNLCKNDLRNYGQLNFAPIYYNRTNVAVERIKCLIYYFVRESHESSHTYPDLVLTRSVVSEDDFPNWYSLDTPLRTENVIVHDSRMEDCVEPDGLALFEPTGDPVTVVDFANKQIHIGVIIDSCTQEEVLFSCSSECFMALLLCQRLDANEVVVIQNVRRSVEYTGYLLSFRTTGWIRNSSPMNALVIDAAYANHFSRETVLRDMNKAWIGYKACPPGVISTGHWGCGAFGGNETFKFLQQLCVASYLDRKLAYSTFKDKTTANQFTSYLEKLSGKTIADVMQIFAMFKLRKPFEKYFQECLESM